MTDQDQSNRVNNGVWEKIRILLGLVLLATIAYEMGLSRARSEKSTAEYLALKTQYDRIETENSALRAQYDRVLTEYSASKAQCSETLTEYSALRTQYQRIEAKRTKASQQ